MMSPEHSLSGAAAGYITCVLIELAAGIELPWIIPHTVAAVVAGWANWPDCDTRQSTVSTSLGYLTLSLHHLVTIICAAVYYATRTDKDPANKPRIHRGATHTWPGALVMGSVVAIICAAYPTWGVPIVFGISLHWAARGIYIPTAIDKPIGKTKLAGKGFLRRCAARAYFATGQHIRRLAIDLLRTLPLPGKYLRALGRTGTAAVCMGIAFYAAWYTHDLDTRWTALLGLAAVLGILVHMLGDSVTEAGICWLFPFVHPRTGRRWEECQLPKWLAFKTGRAFEYAVIAPACILGCLAAMPGGYVLLAGVWTAVWRGGINVALTLPFAAWPRTRMAPPLP
jgi:membrane-bound metal-dependent hydrolase YbcI (DUF457 family)